MSDFGSSNPTPTRPRRLSRVALLAVLITPLAAGCRPRAHDAQFDSASASDHARRLERWLLKHPDDHQARLDLAHVYWLHLGDVRSATTHFDRLTADTALPLARHARATIANHHFDADRVWVEASKLIAEAPGHKNRDLRRQAMALTASAARMIDANLGLRLGDEDAFIQFFEGLDLETYPAEATIQLISTRAHIERVRGGDYRSLYARQGCVQDWQISVLEGYRGALELARMPAPGEPGEPPFKLDPEVSHAALSCAFRVWNPEPESGIRRLRTTVEVPGESLRLTLSAQFPTRVYVDEALVWASDRSDRFPVDEPALIVPTGPGRHRLEVRTAIPNERAWVAVRATDALGRPLEISPEGELADASGGLRWPEGADPLAEADALLEIQPWTEKGGATLGLRGPVYAPLRSYLALEDALADGDTDRAEQISGPLREQADGFASAHLLLADFELIDPSRGRISSTTRQQAELETALEIEPSMTRALLGTLSLRLNRGEVAEVVEVFEALDSEPESSDGSERVSLENLPAAILRYQTYRARGSEHKADQALELAALLHPASCDVLLARREQARDRNQVEVEDQLAEDLRSCPGSVGLRARLALRRQRLEVARGLWAQRLDQIPDDMDAMDAMAEIAVADGRYDEAIAWHEKMLSFAPYRALSHIELADLYAQSSSPRVAREHVLTAIERFPHNSRLREVGERVGIHDALMDMRLDGREALASYRRDRAEGLASEGVSEVLLLDREVSMLYPNGGHRHIVHQMFHLLTDQAIDAHGEFSQPGVELLTMHSIKPDGSVVEPESIAGKDGLSLRGLKIDDVVEIEFVYESGPSPALPGHIDLGRFRFQSPETPFHRSELIVVVPAALEPGLDIEARNNPPTPQRRVLDLGAEPGGSAYVALSFRADQVPRLGAEPQARSMLDELPMIQVQVPLKVEHWIDNLAMELRPAQRSNPELRALAFELTEQYDSTYDKVDALWRWVVDEIEVAGDLSTPATVTLGARQGNRLLLLRAMLEVIDVDTELWLLRDRFGPTIREQGNPLIDTYDTAMLAVLQPGAPPLLVGTSSEVVPLGYLSPSYASGRAVRIQLEGDEAAGGYVQVPANSKKHGDLRRWEIELELDAQGSGRLRGQLELRGIEAIMWRDVFDRVDADKLGEVFTDAELRRILPIAGLDLVDLEFENDWDLDQPLVARFSATVRNGGVVQNGTLATLAAAVPLDQATAYTRLPSRWSGMVISYAPVLEAKVTVKLKGRKFSDVPGDVSIDGARGSYRRRVVAGGVGTSEVVIESRSTLEPGIVEVSAYRELASFAAEVQTAEQQLLGAR